MKVNPVYQEFFENKNRYAILYGGAGSSKSYSIVQKMVMRILSEENHRFLIARKVATTLRVSVFQLFKDIISSIDMLHKFKINKSDMTITNLSNNSQLIFFGLDDVEKIKSIAGITGIFIEEASEISQADFEQLNLRLRGETQYYKQIILAFNPISVTNWNKIYWFDNPKEDSYILKTTYLDNYFIDEEYRKVLESLKHSNYDLFKVYALGLWGTLRGVIYPKFTEIDEMPKIKFDDYGIGVDFGYTDPTAAVECGIAGNDLYLNELIYDTGLITKDIISKLPKETYIYCDAAEPDRIKEMTLDRLWAEGGIKDVMAGINRVKSYNIHITRSSVNVIRDMQTYSWKQDRDGNELDVPDHFHSHAPDAIRYMVATVTLGKENPLTFKSNWL